TLVDLEFSTDGGGNWFPAQAMGGVKVLIQQTADVGSTRLFDTEMLELNLTGNSPAGPFMLRESPLATQRSVGRHTIRTVGNPPAESFLISSFFDVNLELSINGGQTWIPANRPIRVQLVPPCETI